MADMLGFPEKRGEPEERHGTSDTQVGYDERGDGTSGHDEFRNRGHQPPHGICPEHGGMPLPTNFLHFIF